MTRPHSGNRRAARIFTAALAVATAACRPNYYFQDALIALPKAQQTLAKAPNVDVVLVAEDGQVFPKQLLIDANTHAIVWVTAGKSLKITFDDPRIQPACGEALSICVLGPTGLAIGVYGYGGQVTDKNGYPQRLDPKIEIVR